MELCQKRYSSKSSVYDLYVLWYNLSIKSENIHMNTINQELQLLADEHYESIVDAQYDEMTDEFSAEFEMMEYAASSYDADAKYYGEKV